MELHSYLHQAMKVVKPTSNIYVSITYLLQLVGQSVNFKNEILEGPFCGSLGVQEQFEILLCGVLAAVEHFKHLRHATVDADDQPQQLALCEPLAGVQEVGGLAGRRAGDESRGTTALQGVA